MYFSPGSCPAEAWRRWRKVAAQVARQSSGEGPHLIAQGDRDRALLLVAHLLSRPWRRAVRVLGLGRLGDPLHREPPKHRNLPRRQEAPHVGLPREELGVRKRHRAESPALRRADLEQVVEQVGERRLRKPGLPALVDHRLQARALPRLLLLDRPRNRVQPGVMPDR